MRRLLVFATLLFGCALVMGGCARLNLFKRSEAPPAPTHGPRVGSPAPDIDGEDFDGRRLKLSDYRGKVVLVSFWKSDCPPCRALIPHERALVQRYRDRAFVLLGVNYDDDREAALKAINTCGISWRNLQAGSEGSPIRSRWRVEYLPMLYVIDAKGIVRFARSNGADLEHAIDTLLAEAEAKR